MGLDSLIARLRSFAFFPRLQRNEEKRTIGSVDAAQHAEAHDRTDILDAGSLQDGLLDFAGSFRGSLERRGIRQLQAGIDVSLVFIREKALGDSLAEESGTYSHQEEQDKREAGFVDEVSAPTHISVGGAAKDTVEPAEESSQGSPCRLPWAQQQGGKRRTEGECVESREEHGNGDRNRKLLVELAGDTGYEGSGNEHGSKNQCDSNYRSGDFLHRSDGRVVRCHPVLNMMFHRLHDNNGIIDDQSNRQHEPKKRQGVDGESQHRKNGEGSNQRYRNGKQRNQSRPKTLEENVDHQDDQDQSLAQCLVDFVDALTDRERSIQGHNVSKSLGEPPFRLVHHLEDGVSRLQGIAARGKVERDEGCGLS